MCAPPHSLHRLYLPVLLLPANVYVCENTHMHTRTNTRLGDNPRSPNTHKGCVFYVFEQHKDNTKLKYQRKRERNKGRVEERGGGRREIGNRACSGLHSQVEGGAGGGEREGAKELIVCVWHTCQKIRGEKEIEREPDRKKHDRVTAYLCM